MARGNRMKVYISGKITGLSEADYQANFGTVEAILNSMGYKAVNPLKVVPECGEKCESTETFADGSYKHTWQCYMRYDIIELCKCEAIYPLANSPLSRGAQVEIELARKLGLRCLEYDVDTDTMQVIW